MTDRDASRRELWLAILIGVLGCVVRGYYYLRLGGQLHPDEIFQYIEPAHWKIHGYGHLAWEFEKGARNYALSGLYSHFLRIGAWLDMGRYELHRAIWCFDATLTLFLIPAGWRLGQVLAPSRRHLAWTLALLGAVFPVFGYFSVHTLSELHALVLATWGHVLWLDLVQEREARRGRQLALSAGLLFGLAFIIRYACAILVLVAAFDVLRSPRRRHLLWFGLAAAAPFVFIGLVDWAEWGRPFGSFYEYIRVNVGEKYAQRHGVEPWIFYLVQLRDTFGWSAIPVVAGVLVSVVTRPRLTLAWLVPLAGYSLFAHKELRFIIPVLPLILAAAVVGLDDLAAWRARIASSRVEWRWHTLAGAGLLTWMLASVFISVQGWSTGKERGYFVAQDHVGEQDEASGLMVGTTRFYIGGYTLTHRNIPWVFFKVELLDHPLFNYVAVSGDFEINIMQRRQDFALVEEIEGVFLFRRKTPGSFLQ
ncbi:MAG: hypothetical protein ABIJ09_20035 [Pseudomonadota bacterium]